MASYWRSSPSPSCCCRWRLTTIRAQCWWNTKRPPWVVAMSQLAPLRNPPLNMRRPAFWNAITTTPSICITIRTSFEGSCCGIPRSIGDVFVTRSSHRTNPTRQREVFVSVWATRTPSSTSTDCWNWTHWNSCCRKKNGWAWYIWQRPVFRI